MANYSIKTDLLKLQGAFVTNIKGKTATKKCLCVPIDESGLFLGKQGVLSQHDGNRDAEPTIQ